MCACEVFLKHFYGLLNCLSQKRRDVTWKQSLSLTTFSSRLAARWPSNFLLFRRHGVACAGECRLRITQRQLATNPPGYSYHCASDMSKRPAAGRLIPMHAVQYSYLSNTHRAHLRLCLSNAWASARTRTTTVPRLIHSTTTNGDDDCVLLRQTANSNGTSEMHSKMTWEIRPTNTRNHANYRYRATRPPVSRRCSPVSVTTSWSLWHWSLDHGLPLAGIA